MMIAILAEDRSDAETLAVIIRRLLNDPHAPLRQKGFSGCGELCRKGAAHIKSFMQQGVKRFVVCHDADRADPTLVKEKVSRQVVSCAGAGDCTCIVVPVQEIEAWIIADEAAINAVIPSFTIKEIPSPERLDQPKEWLTHESRTRSSRPLYIHTIHNAQVARHLDFSKVARKCPSFRPLVEFVC